jgi:hypothetical protein
MPSFSEWVPKRMTPTCEGARRASSLWQDFVSTLSLQQENQVPSRDHGLTAR